MIPRRKPDEEAPFVGIPDAQWGWSPGLPGKPPNPTSPWAEPDKLATPQPCGVNRKSEPDGLALGATARGNLTGAQTVFRS